MIHYSCDCCKRELAPEDLRYVVKMEVYAAFDPNALEEAADDRDHLQKRSKRSCSAVTTW